MNNNLILTDKTVLEEARSLLEYHLELHAEGYKCATEDLLNVLLAVAADQGTIKSVCADLVATPNPETTRFYRVATAYILVKNLRFTLSIRFVLPGTSKVAVVRQLLQQVQDLQIPLHRLLLDRGFAGIAVQKFLDQQKIPALIACPIRGKRGNTRALCLGHGSYRTQHTFKGAHGKSRTAELAVCRIFTTAKRTKRLKRRATWHLFILIQLDMSPRQVRRLYRRRFGIETSYRCAGKVRSWTTSPNLAYRFLLMALGMLLANIWTLLRWTFTQRPRRGGRLLDTRKFQLDRFAKFIVRALQRHYGYVHQITAVVEPLM